MDSRSKSGPLFPSNTFGMPSNSPFSSPAAPFGQSTYSTLPEDEEDEEEEYEEEDGEGEEYEDEEEDYEQEEEMDEDDNFGGSKAGTPAFRGFTSINAGGGFQGRKSPHKKSSQFGASKSNFGASSRRSQRSRKPSALPGSGKSSVIPGIARDLAARSQYAKLHEPDDMILMTENIISEAVDAVEQEGKLTEAAQEILSHASSECLKLWSKYSDSYTENGMKDGLGPGESGSDISKATFLTSLLLSLHHPPIQQARPHLNTWASNTRSLAIAPLSTPQPAPMPQVLLEWLDKYHISVEGVFMAVQGAEPNCTAHELFWETILGLLVRGKLTEIIQLFSEADFRHAASAVYDGETRPGYRGAQLQSVQAVVARARQLLEASPAVRYGDWNVSNSDWSMYRKKVESELDYLAETAEGGDRSEDDELTTSTFQAENFGLRNSSRNLSQTTRRAQSNVPWTIYQNLKIFYNILLGGAAEIMAQSQDWLEATLALTVWWDGTQDDNIASWSLSVSRQAAKTSKNPVTEDPYLSRLSAAFLSVTDPDVPDSFQINTLSQLEVGLASVLQGNVEGVLGSLKSWSLVIASAVAEIGVSGGWIQSTPQAKPSGLDDEDLMVLSYGQEQKAITKDSILHRFAEELFEKEEMHFEGEVKEGWELAIAVATRLDDKELAKTTISHLLEDLHLVSQDRMDKLVMLCTDLGLEEQARNVSERFADHLISTTTLYGPALICFARAHATAKLRTLVSLLISYSLVSSVAYPLESELDPSLAALLYQSKTTFTNLAEIDAEAASVLQFHLAGYASLRKFYSLRDADFLPEGTQRSALRPLARTRLASKYLIAVINSAADAIYGGLYDAQRESAVQVDGLLALLGEASALLSQYHPGGKRILAKQQIYELLRAIEDLQTVNERVFSVCQECFNATIRNAKGGEKAQPPDPMTLLKKSVSSGSGSNFSFSMMGSEMLNSGSSLQREASGGRSIGGSGVLIPPNGSEDKILRGWDWRKNFGSDVQGEEIMDTLRKGLANELTRAILRGDV